MGHSFGLLLAGVLPASLLIYLIGTLFLKRLRLTGITKAVGFLVAWLVTAIVALIMAKEPSANSAMEVMGPAAFIGAVVGLLAIALAGKRKPLDTSTIL
mgnify:CR=1 FL=1